MLNPSNIPLFRRGYRMQWEAAQECYVILYPEGMAKLNESATAILQLVDGQRSIDEIIIFLEHKFADAEGIKADVLDFFQVVVTKKWILVRDGA